MKKVIYILIIASAITGCVNPTTSVQTDNTLRIEQFVDTFLVQHPDWNNNSVTREQANKEFKELFLSTMEKENLLEGVPMNLHSVHKVKKKNMVHFDLLNSRFEYKQLVKYDLGIYHLYGDIIGAVPDSLLDILIEGQSYEVSGHFIGELGNIEVMRNLIGYNEMAWSNEIYIRDESLGQEVSVGIIYMDIDSIRPFSGRKSYPIQSNQNEKM
ncbi:MAG: hypothetical protein K5660_02545 [Paludibacteraceae bacterium]|nr:hypothetical protein [Paludibacteraceae bacterium]